MEGASWCLEGIAGISVDLSFILVDHKREKSRGSRNI